MEKSKLFVATQGIQGCNFSPYKKKGLVVIAIDGEPHDALRITVDSYNGIGNNYHQRDTAEIKVTTLNTIFKGTPAEFIECLKLGKEKQNEKS